MDEDWEDCDEYEFIGDDFDTDESEIDDETLFGDSRLTNASYGHKNFDRRALQKKKDKLRRYDIDLIFEAKINPNKPFRTMLTIEHFKEMMKFEEWLMRLEYPIVPGRPRGWPSN